MKNSELKPRAESDPLLAFLSLTFLLAIMGFLSAWQLGRLAGDVYDLEIFLHQFIVHETSGAVLTASVLALAALLSANGSRSRIEKVVLFFTSHPAAIAAVTLVLLAFGSLFIYHNHPLSMDEYMPSFQARVFAEGEIYGQFPPNLISRLIPAHFINRSFVGASLTSGKVISTYYPGFAVMLTPFMTI